MAQIEQAAFTHTGHMIAVGQLRFEGGNQEDLPEIPDHLWIAINLSPASSNSSIKRFHFHLLPGHPGLPPSGFHKPVASPLYLSMGADMSAGLSACFQCGRIEEEGEYNISSRLPAQLNETSRADKRTAHRYEILNPLLKCRKSNDQIEVTFTAGPLLRKAEIASEQEDTVIETQLYLTFSVSLITVIFRFGLSADPNLPPNPNKHIPLFNPSGNLSNLEPKNILQASSGQILAHDGSQIYECWFHKGLTSRRVSAVRYASTGLVNDPLVSGDILTLNAVSFELVRDNISWARDFTLTLTGDRLGDFQHLSGYAAADNGGPVFRSVEKIQLTASLTRQGLKIELECDLSAMTEGSGDVMHPGPQAFTLTRSLIFNWETLIARNLLNQDHYQNIPT